MMAVVQEPMKHEFGLCNAQVGAAAAGLSGGIGADRRHLPKPLAITAQDQKL
jgi:hypothetical protein